MLLRVSCSDVVYLGVLICLDDLHGLGSGADWTGLGWTGLTVLYCSVMSRHEDLVWLGVWRAH